MHVICNASSSIHLALSDNFPIFKKKLSATIYVDTKNNLGNNCQVINCYPINHATYRWLGNLYHLRAKISKTKMETAKKVSPCPKFLILFVFFLCLCCICCMHDAYAYATYMHLHIAYMLHMLIYLIYRTKIFTIK